MTYVKNLNMTSHSPLPLRRGGNQTFGRRLGRPLSQERKSALALLDTLAISPDALATPAILDPRSLFQSPVDRVFIEIGFGSGEHLLARMQAGPQDGFIAAEPYINGMSAMLVGLGKQNIPSDRLRVYMNDGLHIINALAPASVDGIYVLNPDPWPKKKHHKRRIINSDNLKAFARILRPGGTLTLSTDVLDYAYWMIEHLSHPDILPLFTPTDQTRADPSVPPTDWPLVTRYMHKGIIAGRKPHYFVYTRDP